MGVLVVQDQHRLGNTTDSDHLTNLLTVDKLDLRMMSELVISKHSVLNSSNILLSGVRMRRKKEEGWRRRSWNAFTKKTGTKSFMRTSQAAGFSETVGLDQFFRTRPRCNAEGKWIAPACKELKN